MGAADYLGPLAILGLTIWAALKPPDTWVQRAPFIVIGVISAAFQAYSTYSSNKREANMQTWATGGENYCYLKADLAAANKPDDGVPWWLVNGGSIPIEKLATWVARYKPNLTRFDKEYWEFPNQPRGYRTCGLSPVWSGFGAGRGDYQIDISTPGKHFVEVLKIAGLKGELEQSISVKDDSGKIQFSTDGFVK